MSSYQPDGWVCLRVETPKWSGFRIFGSWAGGYATGDRWRLSSGFTEQANVTTENGLITLPQESGSKYNIMNSGQGQLTMHNRGVLKNMIDTANKENGLNIQKITLDCNSIETILGSLIAAKTVQRH
ncbi:hypothetical protein [Vibrio barjaei]|uniref:hypothetical protein n=1 Tax=Vibrio barjaei TaxID=1676683 RepID=UPI0022845FF3|nr:hypothetical protein [Vibrio barjaei]MCY9870391.1 hypothetical protein [Vibrio barjaei]